MSVAEYMRMANTAYYGRADPLGVEGDFITAPEISQMFGEMVGIWLSDLWLRHRPARCHYVELGPGRGTLAADALRTMQRCRRRLPRHHSSQPFLPSSFIALLFANARLR